jgi:hypothetical protein
MMYKISFSPTQNKVIFKDENGVRVSFVDPSIGNIDYEEYLEWLAEGNEPEVVE